jgi:hypothetical protein
VVRASESRREVPLIPQDSQRKPRFASTAKKSLRESDVAFDRPARIRRHTHYAALH